ncbi:MAG: DUF5674 family protein [Lachnospiraceae bacterium]|nr:DUF5674 family protein [Lachnospiraceae bacterium]
MLILEKEITLDELMHIEPVMYFDDMIKCVADIDRGLLAVNAEMYADLEALLLEQGSSQKSLYGFNIWEDGDIEFDSLINPPRNREAGYPRAGRYVADPDAREKIREVVEQWVNI